MWKRIKSEPTEDEVLKALTPHSASTAIMSSIINFYLILHVL